MNKDRTIVWFRQDLRLTDNPALAHAVNSGAVLPIYIWDETTPIEWLPGGASKWWLHKSLESLDRSMGGNLQLFKGDAAFVLNKLCRTENVNQVVWNRCYDPYSITRDSQLKKQLAESQISTKSFNGSLLWEPMQIAKKDGTPYKVFTPYYRKGCLQSDSPRFPIEKPQNIEFITAKSPSRHLDSLELMPNIPWYQTMESLWSPGEQGAKERLSSFVQERANSYKQQRDFPSIESTSRLSPHLHFGEVSPNQIWYAINNGPHNPESADIDCYLSELGWREFSYYLLYHFPTLPKENFQIKFDKFPWGSSKQALKAWQKGLTGIPIVDAGMRELWQTGTMHNRVRMITASFLVKNLLIDWREGAKWFWDCLLDADIASNSASWQWVAGSGADAAPYFRIFNPVTQGQKFDKSGDYVKRFCPELRSLPDKYIHCPWEAPPDILKFSGVQLGEHYPHPIADLKSSREQALLAYNSLKLA